MGKAFIVLCLALTGITNYTFSQNKTVNIYYDSTWQTTSVDKAFYRRKFVELQDYYTCFTFWAKNNKLYSKSYCLDMSPFPKKIGIFKSYYENGQLKDSMKYLNNGRLLKSYKYFETGELSDSISYSESGEIMKADHYYINGKPFVRLLWDEEAKEAITEAYDEKGDKINNFIYSKNAEFSFGSDVWKKYLGDNINFSLPFTNKAPKGIYKVLILFTISEEGDVGEVNSETNFGYGMEDESIRVIKASAKWKPGIYLGKIVKSYRRQPITFIVD